MASFYTVRIIFVRILYTFISIIGTLIEFHLSHLLHSIYLLLFFLRVHFIQFHSIFVATFNLYLLLVHSILFHLYSLLQSTHLYLLTALYNPRCYIVYIVHCIQLYQFLVHSIQCNLILPVTFYTSTSIACRLNTVSNSLFVTICTIISIVGTPHIVPNILVVTTYTLVSVV